MIRDRDRDRGRGRDRDYDRHRDQAVYGYGREVPPGLAKKPGQMPPGQYKKLYGTRHGADVLRRAMVRPDPDRLVFQNVPSTLIQEVLSRLY